MVTAQSQAVVWQTEQTPFGEVTQTTGSLAQPLRFPGQYADPETGYSYNYFRDYDPSVGRYVQSDPIGLAGGVNTYGYVDQNPLIKIDPFGLETCRRIVSCVSLPVTTLVYCSSQLVCTPDMNDPEERACQGTTRSDRRSDWYFGGSERGFNIFTIRDAESFGSPLPSSPGFLPPLPLSTPSGTVLGGIPDA